MTIITDNFLLFIHQVNEKVTRNSFSHRVLYSISRCLGVILMGPLKRDKICFNIQEKTEQCITCMKAGFKNYVNKHKIIKTMFTVTDL